MMVIFWLLAWVMMSADIPYDEPLTVTLDGQHPVLLTFEGQAGQGVTLTANRADDDNPLNDPVLAIVYEGVLLAYNNQHGTDSPELAPQDAQIRDFILPADGVYTVYVNTYGGIYAGDLIVTLQGFDIFRTQIDEVEGQITLIGHLPQGEVYQGYSWQMQAGDTVTITAQDAGRTLDPILYLLDSDGAIIAWNDDHAGHDLTLDAFDAQIWQLVVPVDDMYTLRLVDFLGQSGNFIITIVHEPLSSP